MWAIPVAQTDQLNYHPDPHPGLRLAYPNIYPAFDLLKCMKGVDLWISITWAITGYLRGISVSV